MKKYYEKVGKTKLYKIKYSEKIILLQLYVRGSFSVRYNFYRLLN